MIIIGEPDNIEDYYFADGELAVRLHQAGFIPKYKADCGMYFKISHKLLKFLAKIGEEI